jgi:hypothetical protein
MARKGDRWLLEEQPECKHTPRPTGYLPFVEFARVKSKTHRQERCPVCGLWAIWVPKKKRVRVSGESDG